MAENEKTLEELIAQYKERGYSDARIKGILKLEGHDREDIVGGLSAFDDSKKKNQEDLSQSASPSGSEPLQESPSGISSDDSLEASASDSSTDRFADNEVVRTNRTREVGALLNERQRQEELAKTKYDEFESRKTYNEDLGEWEYTSSSWDNLPVQFIQEGGPKSITDKEADIQTAASSAAYFGVQEGKSKEEVIDRNFKATGIDQEIEQVFSEAVPEFEGNFFYTDEETGLQQVNPVALGKWAVQMDEVMAKEEEMLKKEMDILEDKSELGEIGYDMWTGVRGQANGILGLWNPEQAQYNLYADGFRTQASYKVEGLTDEDIEKGIFGNVVDGNMGAASTILGTQLAQTAPQLIIQALITKGAGAGFSAAGLSAKAAGSAAMWTSSAYMGASTFGTTSAQYYGLVDDNKRFTMALGDALVETLSERAFPDDMIALTKKTYKGASIDAIRRDFFGVGVMSKEFRNMAFEHVKRTGIQVLESGLEEGMEEMLAGIGSQWVHAMVNDEEFNMFEVIDGMIVGFGAGAKSRGVRALGETITATASSMGFGGFRNDLVKIKGAKQKLSKELAETTDATRKAQLETKLKSLSKIELGIKAEMDGVYSEYSDEDASATIEANQKAQHNIQKAQDKSLDAETRKQARMEAKSALNTIKSIEAKYGDVVANNKAEKEAVKNFDYGDTGSVEIGADTDAQGSRLVEGLKTIQKALGVSVKVHDSYDAMAKDLGVEVDVVSGTRGLHKASDGSVHIFLPAAQNNTSYHEAFHEIAMGIDPKLVNRFIEGAIAGMDEDLAQKYKDFGSQYEGSPELMEEIFAELMADITTGAITVEGAGASIASLAMAPVLKQLKKLGLYKGSTAGFKQFATFVQSESNRLKTGDAREGENKFSREGQTKRAAEFAKQLANEAEMAKLPPQERMSPEELLGSSFNPETSTIWQFMPMNAAGNFVFAHTSNAELDNVDPRFFGQNIKTSQQERQEVGLAGVSVSMWGLSPADIDITGANMYQVELSPREVYNAVDDPEGFVDQARAQLKEQGKGATANTVYALATKIAAKSGYKMTVTPWTANRVKVQSTQKLDVTPYQEFERVKLYPNDTWVKNEGTDIRSQVNDQAKRVLAKIKGRVTAAVAQRIDKMTYGALEGRFGFVANLQEWTELLQEADNELNGELASEVASSMQIADTKGGSVRVIDAATRKKVIDNVMAKMAARVDGFSIDPMTGEDMTEGTAVGDGKAEIEMDYDAAADISRSLAEEVLDRVLANPLAVVGGWFKPENSKFYLDSSEVYASQAVGERLGRKRKEFGVYNIKTGEFISTVESEDRDGRDLKAQRISEVEKMTEIMNAMPAAHVEWTEPVGTASVIVDPVKLNGQPIPAKVLKALGYKSKSDLVKPTSYYNGIPSIPAMSDMLGSGQMKDANGNDMEANGGIGWGLWGRGLKDGAAWCGVTRHDAEVQLNDALNVYNANKSFFEKLWADGVLPNGHVPMFIMRMADTAINSNEAVLRHLAPYIQNFPKENRKAALVELTKKMQEDFDWLTEKVERAEQGLPNMDKRTRTVKDPSKKQVGLTELEKNQFQAQKRLLDFVQENKFETLDELLLAISENSKQRARAAVTKKDADSYLQLIDKEYLTSIMLRPHAETIDGYKAKSGSKPYIDALFGELEGDVEKFTFHSVMNGIAEPSMRQVKANHAVAVMGVDVLNPAVVKVGHENYGFGPRGRFISFLSDPQHGADIFPEWEVKLSRMARGGTSQAQSTVLSSVGSTFFGDKVFRGAAVETETNDVKRVIAKMRHAFPHVHISRDSAEFDEMIKSGEIEGKMSKKGVTIYGVSKGGRIFMNPIAESVDTAIHEFGHVWMDFLATGGGKQGKQILAKGLELAKETELYKAKLEIYGDPSIAAEETLAELIAQKGVQIIEAAKASKFKSWMKGMYEFVTRNLKTIYARDGKDSMRMSKAERDAFIERLTLDDFTNLSIAELFQGKQVKSSYRPTDDGSAKARARAEIKAQKISPTEFDFETAPNGKIDVKFRGQYVAFAFATMKEAQQWIKERIFEEGRGGERKNVTSQAAHMPEVNPSLIRTARAIAFKKRIADHELAKVFNTSLDFVKNEQRIWRNALMKFGQPSSVVADYYLNSNDVDKNSTTYRFLEVMKEQGVFDKFATALIPTFKDLDGERAAGKWSFVSDRVIAVIGEAQTTKGANGTLHTFVHEHIHGITSLGIKQSGELELALTRLMEDAKSYNNDASDYGFTNIQEFMAEAMSKPEFQIKLMNTPISERTKELLDGMGMSSPNNSVWSRFMEILKAALKPFLTLDPNTESVLESVVKVFSREQERSENSRAGRSYSGFFQQKGVYKMVANAIKEGKKKSEIVQDLKEAGFTEKDARLMYEKAVGYNVGRNAGMRAGVKARNEAYKEKRKAQLENERVEAKLLRQRAREIWNRERKITDKMINEVADYLKEKKINIKPSQLKTILRLMSSAHRKLRGKTADTNRNYAIFLSFTDAVAKIIDKQMDAKQIEEHTKLLRSVISIQKKLKSRMKKISGTSKSPLISYSKEINDLVSIDAGVLSFETLETLATALLQVEATAKNVSTTKDKDGNVILGKPYVEVDGERYTLRRAKIYFNEVYAMVKNEEVQRTEQRLIEQAMDLAYEDGTDWYTAYQELIRQKAEKNMAPMQKKLQEIAKELGLDLENVDDMETAFELYAEQQGENEAEVMRVIFEESVMPAIQTHLSLLVSDSDFQALLGYDPELSEEVNMERIEKRLKALSLSEMKRLEFFMFDFVANGKTYGLKALSATVRAKTDGNRRLAELNMVSKPTKGAGSSARKGYFGLFENTPTFFRRLFKQYSQGKVAQYMNAIGFGAIRKKVAQAEMLHEMFVKEVREMLKEKGLLDSKAQTQMQIYSVLRQKPEGMTDAAWVVYLKNSMQLALDSDTRLTEEQKEQITEAMAVFKDGRRSRSLSEILEQLEQTEGLTDAVSFIEAKFLEQTPKVKAYAESFLGMHFKEEANYLPMMFRAVGSKANSVDELIQKVENIGKAFGSHSLTKANAQASSTYERDANALKSNKRYIDLNFLSAIEKTYKENEIKSATAEDVAYISAMTSEKNEGFVETIEDADDRARVRKNIYNYLVNASDYQQADEVLGKRGAKVANYAMNATVVAYFGATIEQILKQGSALFNAMIETRSIGARMVYMEAIGDLIKMNEKKGKVPEWYALAKQFTIGGRDVVSETLMVGAEGKIGEKTRFEKGVDLSTTALRETDKVAATATWLAYYADYLISEEGRKSDEIDWAEEAANPNNDAAMFAEQMTVKDQNINTRRDKARLNEIMRGQALGMVKMVVMPFANFLFNKKLNLALDVQKLFIGDAKNRKEGVRSIAGTVAEVAAFQGVAWMVLAPIYSALGTAVFGSDDEDESWWDANFGKKMFMRGMFLDMNPAILPVAAMENYAIRGMNIVQYMMTEDSEDFTFADEDWSKGFERWEKLNGFPIFKGAGRGDLGSGGFFSMLGVTGNVAHDMTLATQNLASLNSKNPYYTNTAGTKRYVSREDAAKMALIEGLRLTQYGIMMSTGLYSKELAKITKAGKKPIERRSTQDYEQWIAGELMDNASVGVQDMLEYLAVEVEGDPTHATQKIDAIIKKAKGDQVNELVSGENINTLRTIDKAETSNRGRAIFIHQIAQTMDADEAKQFILDSYIYFGVKYGVETVKSQIIADVLKYGKEDE